MLQDLSINSYTVVDVFQNFPTISPGNNTSSRVYKQVQDNFPLLVGKPGDLVICIRKYEKKILEFQLLSILNLPFMVFQHYSCAILI
jgi:hypothetical protein